MKLDQMLDRGPAPRKRNKRQFTPEQMAEARRLCKGESNLWDDDQLTEGAGDSGEPLDASRWD